MVELCPRALEVLKRQLAVRARLKLVGKINRENVFFRHDGSQVRYRDPYSARHSCVSWNLMAGKNILWVAKQHGHSVSTLLTTYAAWTEGATDADVEAIKRAMEQRPRAAQIVVNATFVDPLAPPEFGTGLALESVGRRVSLGFHRELHGGKGRDSNPRPRHYERSRRLAITT